MINQYNPTCNNPEQQLTIDVDAHSSAEKIKISLTIVAPP